MSEIPAEERLKAESLPVGQYLNIYGTTNAKVNFRSGPSTDAARKGTLNAGENVYIIANEVGGDGAVWSRVSVNGDEGYLKSEFLDAMSLDSSNRYNQSQASPAPVYTAVPALTEEPTAAPTAEPSAEPTAEPTTEPSAEPAVVLTAESLPVGQMINVYGITNAKVNFRAAPASDSARKGSLSSGKHVYIIRNEVGNDGSIWSRVNADGEEGYLKSEFVNVMSLDDSNSYNQAQSSPAPVYTATPAPTAEPTPVPTAEPTPVVTPEPTAEPTEKPTPEPVEVDEIQNRYVKTSKNVNFRKEASTNSSSMAVASSAIITEGSMARIPAIATRCFWPPDSWWGAESANRFIRTAESALSIRGIISSEGIPRFSRPKATSSFTTVATIWLSGFWKIITRRAAWKQARYCWSRLCMWMCWFPMSTWAILWAT